MRWVWRGTALAALLIGWVFITWQNHFHITAPVVFVCLAYLAVVATVYNLWRTGAAAVSAGDDTDDSTWVKPAGRLGELEREKRTLLKAIKEAEFDHQMGKLSKHDADDMIRVYRARAIEVIKDIDHLGLGAERRGDELSAIAEPKKGDAKRGAADSGAKGKKVKDKAAAGKKASADDARADSAADKAGAAAAAAAGTAEKTGAAAAASAGEDVNAASDAAGEAAADAAAPVGAASLDEEAMNADSTTAVDPAREQRAKEATR